MIDINDITKGGDVNFFIMVEGKLIKTIKIENHSL